MPPTHAPHCVWRNCGKQQVGKHRVGKTQGETVFLCARFSLCQPSQAGNRLARQAHGLMLTQKGPSP